ncbi:hypothetical protein HAHE_20560 [Haloferula helveola]|uniref:Uncharacterized protein n=1 Tax=Haloferula helveola TaxID=490095 RepID=A0ABN6H4X3_9BACT|nr:hypothetical protein HAHE_20560 [Haloferula helveola]
MPNEIPRVGAELTPEQREKAMAWFEETCKPLFLPEKGCPSCGNTNWELCPYINEMRTLNESRHGGGYVFYPLLTIQCTKCAQILNFNGIDAGVLPPGADTTFAGEKIAAKGGPIA